MTSKSMNALFALVLVFSFVVPTSAYAALSRAEGTDRTAAARASQWTGTIIGVNFGEHSVVITEGTALDHIKKFAQRSIKISSDTQLFKNDEPITFEDLDVGQRITATGEYNAAKRIIAAERVDLGARVATAPAPKAQAVAAIDDEPQPAAVKKAKFTKNLKMGSSGSEVIALQKILIAKKYLPSGTKLGNFGAQTKSALQKFQKASGISATGSVGPQTRTKLNKI